MTTRTEEVAVVIPAFNSARYIAEAIESVLSQTLPARQLIVIDDGSTDATAAVAAAYSGVTLIRQARRGVSAARNMAVEATSTEFVAFLDSDDIWRPDKLRLQVQRAGEVPTAGLVTCRQKYTFEFGVPAWFRGPTDGSDEAGLVPSSWLVRRATWATVGGFDEGMTHAEDVDWLARASDLGVEVATVDVALVTRRIHDANASGMAAESVGGMLQALRNSVRRKQSEAPT